MEQELKEVKAELKRITSIQPEDNLRFLVNQIEVGNISTSDNKRVLNILNEVNLGIKNLKDKNNKLIDRKKKQVNK
jgi:hypothetical protein